MSMSQPMPSAGENCMRMYYQVDAFAEGLFAGNPAAVLVP